MKNALLCCLLVGLATAPARTAADGGSALARTTSAAQDARAAAAPEPAAPADAFAESAGPIEDGSDERECSSATAVPAPVPLDPSCGPCNRGCTTRCEGYFGWVFESCYNSCGYRCSYKPIRPCS